MCSSRGGGGVTGLPIHSLPVWASTVAHQALTLSAPSLAALHDPVSQPISLISPWPPVRKLRHREAQGHAQDHKLSNRWSRGSNPRLSLFPGPQGHHSHSPHHHHPTSSLSLLSRLLHTRVITASHRTPKSAFVTPTALRPSAVSNARWAIPPACQHLSILRLNSSSS